MVNSWLNGVSCDHIAIDDRAVLLGDSCFTTVAVNHGEPQLWERHLERLALTLARLKFPFIDLSTVTQEVAVACSGVDKAILRVTLTRGSGGRGYALPVAPQIQRLLLRREWPQDIAQKAEAGIGLRWCETRLASQPLLAGLKHGNRLEQVLARAEWQDPAIAEGLMCDSAGRVIEATTSNLFFCDGQGIWCTPSLTQCGVAGVMRAEIVAQLQSMGIAVQEADYFPADVSAATEIFVCNSVVGIWPVVGLGDLCWPIGPRTRALQRAIGRSNGR